MEGTWIFLSHSSKDIAIIRKIRNEFEAAGKNPLAFHLKCLSTDTAEGRKELLSLIHREIDAREWFVFCESENSRQSDYVRDEQAYVIESGKKKIFSLDLNCSFEAIQERIQEIIRLTKVYISCCADDLAIAQSICFQLEQHDFEVILEVDNVRERDLPDTYFAIFLVSEVYLSSEKSKELLANSSAKQQIVFSMVDYPVLVPAKKVYYVSTDIREEDWQQLTEFLVEVEATHAKGCKTHFSARIQDAQLLLEERLNIKGRFHTEAPILVHRFGAMDDYCEGWKYPCCGVTLVTGDRAPGLQHITGCHRSLSDKT